MGFLFKSKRQKEKEMDDKLTLARVRAAAANQQTKERQAFDAKKAELSRLQAQARQNSAYGRIRAKTSPVLRRIEAKVVAAAKKAGPGIMRGASRFGENRAQQSNVYTAPRRKSSTKKKGKRRPAQKRRPPQKQKSFNPWSGRME